MSSPSTRGDPTVRELRHELDLVQSAIRLVATGGATRVRLGALTFGEPLLDRVRRMGSRAGVQVTPEWTASDGGGIGLIVERVDDAGS
jgi:hypothetical protein